MFIWVFGVADDFPKDDKICCWSFAAVAPAAADSLRVDYATFIHIPRKKAQT